jgi:hypothetical protein
MITPSSRNWHSWPRLRHRRVDETIKWDNVSLLILQRPDREAAVMNLPVKRILFWTPRALCLLFAAFVSLFALDVFGEGHGFLHTMFDLLMHLIPTGVILVALAISWRWERVGGLLFFALGAWYVVGTWGRFHWSAYAVIAGPLFLLGALFELEGWLRRNFRATQAPHAK